MSHGSFYRSQQGRGYIADLTVETPDYGEGGDNAEHISLSSDQYNHENWWAPTFDPLQENQRRQLSYSQPPHRTGGDNLNKQRPDRRIWREICTRMTDDSYLDASNIEVAVENGEVMLTGEVDSRESKRLAEHIADSVAGVVDIHNRLRIHRPGRI